MIWSDILLDFLSASFLRVTSDKLVLVPILYSLPKAPMHKQQFKIEDTRHLLQERNILDILEILSALHVRNVNNMWKQKGQELQ